ncbi:MAG: hypothetical protein WBA10_07720 [Elainellaceae cyanobacterium]
MVTAKLTETNAVAQLQEQVQQVQQAIAAAKGEEVELASELAEVEGELSQKRSQLEHQQSVLKPLQDKLTLLEKEAALDASTQRLKVLAVEFNRLQWLSFHCWKEMTRERDRGAKLVYTQSIGSIPLRENDFPIAQFQMGGDTVLMKGGAARISGPPSLPDGLDPVAELEYLGIDPNARAKSY